MMEIVIVIGMMFFVLTLGLMMTPSPSFEDEGDSIQTATNLVNSGKVSEGRSMLEQLVEQGNHEAAIALAQLVSQPLSDEVEDEKEMPAYWYEKAALLDERYARRFMSTLENDRLPNGEYWAGAEDKLEELLTQSALNGDIEAQEELGEFYYNRLKYDKTKEKALQWLEKSAEDDDSYALVKLGDHYHNLHMNEEPNSILSYASKARSYYERAYNLGELASNYANMLLKGIGGKVNTLDAEKILTELAEGKGAGDKRLELAKHYSEGEYLTKDIDKARYWHERALDGNESCSHTQIAFANFLISHSNQDTDMIRAKKIVEKYVSWWDESALFVLAKMYHTGCGVRKNALSAAMYYELAAKSYYIGDLGNRDELFSQLRDDEKRQVQDMVDHYIAKNPIPSYIQPEMDLRFAQLTFMDEKASESDKENAIKALKILALSGDFEAVDLLPSSYASMNRTFESVVWQKVALEIDLTMFGGDKEAEYHFEQQAKKLTQEQRQWLEEESKAFITLVKEGLPA